MTIKPLAEKIQYSVREIHAERIRELIKNTRYRNPEEFLKTAIDILLTWESARPEECMDLMRERLPFTPEQEAFMSKSMNPEEMQKQFGSMEMDRNTEEAIRQKKLAGSDLDHLELRENLTRIKKYIENIKIKRPKNIIPYDGYPRLSGFYSRILPVKIVLSVLCHLLEQNKDSKVELNDLRVHAYDIAEELADITNKHENERNTPRNKKISTGLPKKGTDDHDGEKILMAQKRFKDQFVGKIRRNRVTKENHFEGALSALELVFAFESEGRVFVSLTEAGKKFFLLDNPIVMGQYEKRSLSVAESDFILKRLIPKRELEHVFVGIALKIIGDFQSGTIHPRIRDGKITTILDREIRQAALQYAKENPESTETYNLNSLKSHSEAAERKIAQWRLATMGRLAELGAVNWRINEKGDSEYSII